MARPARHEGAAGLSAQRWDGAGPNEHHDGPGRRHQVLGEHVRGPRLGTHSPAPAAQRDPLRKCARSSSVLLKLETSSFMQRGADVSFLSAFPAEAEILFPPLTFLEPKSGDDGKPRKVEVVEEGGVRVAITFHVITVVPHFGT